MRIAAIIQARTGSTRLPEKILKKICGIPVLIHVIRRLEKCKNINEIILATTTEENDNKIIDILKNEHIKIFRGSEEDVLDRYYNAALNNNVDIVVRVTSDDPLIDYRIIDKIVEKLIKENTDYSCNNIPRTYPLGLDCECFKFKALKLAWENAEKNEEREHVTPYIRKHEDLFKKSFVTNDENYSHLRWTLDTKEDFKLINTIYEYLYPKKGNDFDMYDILNLYKIHPELEKINMHIKQRLV